MPGPRLPQALQAVLKGQHYLTPLITKELLEETLHPVVAEQSRKRPVATLTPRQREVLPLSAEGKERHRHTVERVSEDRRIPQVSHRGRS